MSNLNVHGVNINDDLNPELLKRDTRPFRLRVHDIVKEHSGIILILLGLVMVLLPIFPRLMLFVGISPLDVYIPQISDLLFIVAIVFYYYSKNKVKTFPFRNPQEADENGVLQNGGEDGITFIGNDNLDQAGIWFSNDDMRTHMLVFGSTGSGKTRFLLGILYQALLVGSGALYVDGKGDTTVLWLAYSICRRLDRLDSFLIINYLTDETANHRGVRLSNTTNPFAHGDSEQLRSLIVGLMRGDGDGDIWKGRTSALMAALLKVLVQLRNKGEFNLDVQKIREYLPLMKCVELTQRQDIPEHIIAPMRKYLLDLPGYTEEDAMIGQLQQKAYEQHGYLTMQLTEVLGDLGDTYGHIFSAPLGEVDFKDVVFNRRILFVMLPALQKDPDALAGLGKLVVAGVRAALAPALGSKVEGSRREVIEQKPTNSKVPFFLILDEYGYYAVKGFAVVAAQARSLGVAVIFAGQDYPSFKRADEIEAQSTIANTNIKICMKLEDPDETLKIIQARAGQAKISETEGFEVRGTTSSYKDQLRARLDTKDRINLRDLVSQKPGEAHVIFGDYISRCRMFYCVPEEVEFAEVNRFLMINPPSKEYTDEFDRAIGKIGEMFGHTNSANPSRRPRINPKSDNDISLTVPGLDQLLGDFNAAISRNESYQEASMISIGMLEVRAKMADRMLQLEQEKLEAEKKLENTPPETELSKDDESTDKESITSESINTEPELNLNDGEKGSNDDLVQTLEIIHDAKESSESLKEQATLHAKLFTDVIKETILENAAKVDSVLTPAQRKSLDPEAILIESELLEGASLEEAKNNANNSLDKINEIVDYIKAPVPNKAGEEVIKGGLDSLKDRLDGKEVKERFQ